MTTNIFDVTEQKRLNEAREAAIPWKKWGAVFERAAVGQGARRLQRERRCVELLFARSGALRAAATVIAHPLD